jgi:hypothetical protein
MKNKIGDRFGAIQKTDEKTVYLFGYGVYVGDEVPPADLKGERGMMSMLHEAKVDNPKIKLDDGTFVYGCECWWGSEEKVKESIRGRKIIIVKPNV